MLESGWNEKLSIKVLCGGEALTKALADKLVANCTSLWNMYGPTETTIWSTLKQVLISDGIITVGQPIDHTDIFILDENGQQLPAGSPGEICIGGAGLARGYLNRADLTGEKFITYEVADHKKLKLYKTGDLGKLLPNNELQCLGRIDHQVKIRGFRIELGEIEAVIQNSGLVSEAVVITREDEDSNKNLVGYVIPSHIQVKLKEKELYKKQVENWEKVYDAEYDKSENTLQTNETVQFNTNIWTDSFTIKTIPTEQMQEWLTDIIRVILAEKPKNILEIGCGTGLIFYQIAPYLDKYIGTDLSRSGINALEKEISKGAVQYPETKLMVCGAHEIELAAEEVIDTIIFNSVIQYFPGEDYLSEVLAKSIPLLNGVGKIIIGDVRDLQTLKLFKSSLALLKLPADVDKKEFLFTADQELLKEEELCVAPGYFYNLRTIYPEITHIDIQWKQAEYINELIAYRYTVVIYVGIKNKVLTPEWIKWSDIVDKDFIKQTIENKPPLIALCDVPNHRLSKQALLDQAIGDSSLYTTGDILNYISKPNNEYLEASQIINLAKANGYHLSFFVNSDPLKLNLLLQLDQGVQFIQPHNDDVLPVERYVTNIPLLSTICTTIQRDIYKTLLAQLPNYMIPASLTMVSQLPLTNNGKTDRQFLMQRSSNDRIPPATYRAARNNVEKRLIEIWQEFLSIDKIGINDNFFELGGNSLIAIRIMITLEKDTGKDLPLSSLFEYPTIEQLASIVQNTGTLNTSKCLVRLKHGGSKTPLYIVHGWGLTVFLFKDLANNLHADQPVFALQGIGIDGFEEPLTKTEDIAARYLSEVLVQNPTGPYSFAGYSLGGVIACEMVKQLRIMGKEVTMLAMFDAYAHTVEKKANITLMAFSLRKMQKFFLRISHNLTQLIKDPNTLNEKLIQINRKLPSWIKKNNILKLQKENDVDFYSNDLSKIYFAAAVQNYKLTANEDIIELFRGSKNIYYYMDDPVYLGWREYAKTVNLYRLKGSHTTMFLPPNDKQFAEVLQQCLDKANS
jgi:thioesterase domain-containing protein/acyl carrier protein/SAM-dependent methyltransferase